MTVTRCSRCSTDHSTRWAAGNGSSSSWRALIAARSDGIGYLNKSSDFLNTCHTPHASGIPTKAHAPTSASAVDGLRGDDIGLLDKDMPSVHAAHEQVAHESHDQQRRHDVHRHRVGVRLRDPVTDLILADVIH